MPRMVRGWWAVLARGIVAAVFGFMAVLFPMEPLALSMLFGITALMLGGLAVIAAIGAPFAGRRGFYDVGWPLLIEGVFGVGFGFAMIIAPFPASSLAFYLAGWAGMTGLLEIASALKIHRVLASERTMIVGGVISLVAAALLVERAQSAELAQWILGCYAVLFGAFLIIAGVRLHRLDEGDLAGA